MEYNRCKQPARGCIVRGNSIKAVVDEDLDGVLKSLGVYDELVAGKKICLHCGKIITLDSVEAIVPHDKRIAFICNSPSCKTRLYCGDSHA